MHFPAILTKAAMNIEGQYYSDTLFPFGGVKTQKGSSFDHMVSFQYLNELLYILPK